ncbi:MAG: hypothetical protein ACOCX4_09045 [Planctomycetota bacterium]
MTVAHVPVRALTQGPKHHWFGYYDKLEFDPAGRRVLGMEVDFEGRSPRAEDRIRIGLVDLADGDRWVDLGGTRAWCWQQGCMLQWLPGSDRKVIYNDREADRFVSRILDVETGEVETVPHPVYALSPDGRTAVAPDFRRINDMRPGYGYAGLPDPHTDDPAPATSGIERIDLANGTAELVVPLSRMLEIPCPHADLSTAKHYFNHLLVSPDGTRFEFLHRWRYPTGGGFQTRMLTAAMDGSDLRVVDDYGGTSHFVWRDPETIIAYSHHPSHGNAFYLYPDTDARVDPEPVGLDVMPENGHCTYLADPDWILNDTYPQGQARLQELYLYHVPTGRRVEIGAFPSPPAYTGEWRCDLHPRSSPDGRTVVFDSTHEGAGRQLYLAEIGSLLDA